jgi:molybdopterin converting factor subunit 1
MVKVKILLFALFAEEAGWSEREALLPDEATVDEAWQSVLESAPGLAVWLRPPLVAVNLEYAGAESPLSTGDEVAFLPPIAGG